MWDILARPKKTSKIQLTLLALLIVTVTSAQNFNGFALYNSQGSNTTYLIDEKKKKFNKTLFVFDEPTSGLHNKDIDNFLSSIFNLIELGNSVIIIEHNTELIKQADWIIDLGPEGGEKGGKICFEGTPNNLILKRDNKTAKYLKKEFV